MPVVHSSMMQRFDGADHYVDGALRLLQYVEARRPTGRRFGADADARASRVCASWRSHSMSPPRRSAP